MSQDLKDAALAFHRAQKPGKLAIQPTKALANQRDLALTYSPAHVLHGSASVRGVLNMTAVAVVEAQTRSIEHDIARALDAQVG